MPITPSTSAPSSVLSTPPRPPIRLAPPITTAAMTSSSAADADRRRADAGAAGADDAGQCRQRAGDDIDRHDVARHRRCPTGAPPRALEPIAFTMRPNLVKFRTTPATTKTTAASASPARARRRKKPRAEICQRLRRSSPIMIGWPLETISAMPRAAVMTASVMTKGGKPA